MTTFNPYYVDEIVTQPGNSSNYFGLISNTTEAGEEELHGYEVTMSGRLELPELRSQVNNQKQLEAFATK
ncbi:MAG: hypothetical protein ACKVZH_01475 [Blastocatellia bacterium]